MVSSVVAILFLRVISSVFIIQKTKTYLQFKRRGWPSRSRISDSRKMVFFNLLVIIAPYVKTS